MAGLGDFALEEPLFAPCPRLEKLRPYSRPVNLDRVSPMQRLPPVQSDDSDTNSVQEYESSSEPSMPGTPHLAPFEDPSDAGDWDDDFAMLPPSTLTTAQAIVPEDLVAERMRSYSEVEFGITPEDGLSVLGDF
eukprot:Hpha_TRINITY_DN3467_c0_g1::TRINITY_DN3467_c0_g1_i2::g.32685::m.32685